MREDSTPTPLEPQPLAQPLLQETEANLILTMTFTSDSTLLPLDDLPLDGQPVAERGALVPFTFEPLPTFLYDEPGAFIVDDSEGVYFDDFPPPLP